MAIFSCSTSNKIINAEYQIVRFKEKIPNKGELKVQDYLFDVLRGGKLIKGKHDFTGSNYAEYRIIYPDSSILYIGNDTWHGSRLNLNNRVGKGINGINRKNLTDSLYFEGVQLDGRYWKENILNDIFVGYVNVKPDEKRKYDEAIKSVRLYK